MASNLPPNNTDSSKPSEGVLDTPKAAPTPEKELASKPREKDLASFVTTHSSQFLSHSQDAPFGVPSKPTGTNVPASERFPLTPVQRDLPKPAAPVAATQWAPPNIGANPPTTTWAPPAQKSNPIDNAAATPIKFAPGWSPPKNKVTVEDDTKPNSAEPKAPIPPKPQAAESNNVSNPSAQGFVKPPVFTSMNKPKEMSSTEKLKYSGTAPPNNGTIVSAQAGINSEATGAAFLSVAPTVTPTATPVAAAPKPFTTFKPAQALGSAASEAIPKPTDVSTSAPTPDTTVAKPFVSSKPAEKPAEVSSSSLVVDSKSSTTSAPAVTASKPTEVLGSASVAAPKPPAVPAPAPVSGVASPPVGAPLGKEVSSTEKLRSAESAPPRTEVIEEAKLGVNPTQEKEAPSEVSKEDETVSDPTKKGSKNLSVSFGKVNKDTPPPATVSKSGAVPSKSSLKAHTKRPATKDPPKEKAPKVAKASVGIPCRSTKVGKVFLLEKENADFLPVSGITEDIVDICSGSHHTLALTASGELYSWGSNEGSALGREGAEEVPTKVEFEEGVEVVQITAGGAISAALTSSGDVYAWGTFYSNKEKLGFIEKPGESQETPIKLSGKLPKNTQFISVAAGENHLLLLTAKGKVYVSGDSEFGQLGVRMLRSRGGDETPQGLRLNAISLQNVVSISAGAHHSFAINKKGEVYGWGSNKYLQCGIASSGLEFEVSLELPSLSQSITALSPQKIVSGESHSIFLTDSNEVFGVGLNDSGSSTSEDGKRCTSSPVAVALPDAKVQDITSGPNHCLAYASPDLYQWGYDESPKKINPIQGHQIFSITSGQGFSVVIASPSDDHMA